jgi:hypothetical protein
MGSIFYKNNNINNIFFEKNINNILIIIETVIQSFILMYFKILL